MTRSISYKGVAKRLDRFMAWFISLGGMTIIAAVLGILLFIGKEAYPLFLSPHSKALATAALPPSSALAPDETGRALATLDAAQGVRGFTVDGGHPLPPAANGPALPWRTHTSVDGKGGFAVLGADHRLSFGRLTWDKPGQTTDPAQWAPVAKWDGAFPVGDQLGTLLSVRTLAASGLAGGESWRVVALDPGGALRWAEFTSEDATPVDDSDSAAPETPVAKAAAPAAPAQWRALSLPDGQHPTCARLSADGKAVFAGTREGSVLFFNLGEDGAPATLAASVPFPEPVSALGFALGQNALLVGGERGGLAAVQALHQDGKTVLQEFHRFPKLDGPVLGFMASQRDKRFLSFSASMVAVDHLTTERRLFSATGQGFKDAALSARGDFIFAQDGTDALRTWSLDAPHPEISSRILWGKVHYEGYRKAEYVWQSSGGTDDFEPKLSLMPLVFGTMKGTFYAMIFALPLAILGALYTSQFATPRLRDTIKPLVEIMAALPSVVLGFLAGLVLAPLFEKSAVSVLLMPLATLLVALALVPVWVRMPKWFRLRWGNGREVAWLLPTMLLGLLVAAWVAPAFERIFLAGDFRAWLLQSHGYTYDQRNSIVVGFAMGFAVIPIIFTISEDALSAVPRSLTSASLACGASPWQTAWRVVLPTASPGIFSAVMVGLGRAIGETMIVLMATGNTPVMEWNPFNGMRTLAANIAVETPEAPAHGTLYRLLFFTALLLFALTFILNTVAELVRQHLRKRYESF
jgi:phosphate transport system permease protein